jgi:hypothetical protein
MLNVPRKTWTKYIPHAVLTLGMAGLFTCSNGIGFATYFVVSSAGAPALVLLGWKAMGGELEV